jgi:sugar-phosphatase
MAHMTTPLTDRTFAAVLFDNDGTLIDSAPAVVRAWTTWADEHGVDIFTLQGFHGVPAVGIIEAVAPHLDQDAALARIIELEEADTTDVLALPGAVDALNVLGDRAAIATSATRDLALARLHAAGIPLPEVIVTVEDITHGKPHPEPYQLAARLIGVDPADCLVVEDAPSGLASARAAGCATLAVVTTGERHELEADLVVPDLSHVRFAVGARGVSVATL